MITALDINTLPSDMTVNKLKSLPNWKLVQVSGKNQVVIMGYDGEGNRSGQSTAVVEAFVSQKQQGVLFRTESGSIYFQSHANRNASLWPLGLQIKRPDLYSDLVKLGVF